MLKSNFKTGFHDQGFRNIGLYGKNEIFPSKNMQKMTFFLLEIMVSEKAISSLLPYRPLFKKKIACRGLYLFFVSPAELLDFFHCQNGFD